MKHFHIFLFILSFISCQTRENIPGVYTLEEDFAYIKLELKPDSIFVYNAIGDLIRVKSEGIWKYDSINIILQSYEDYKSGIVDVGVEEYKRLDSIHIKVIDVNQQPLSHAALALNGQNLKFILNEYGEIKFPLQPIDSIQIYYLGDQYNYNTINKYSDFIELKINLKDLSKRYYFSKKLKIRKNKLILESGEKLYKRRKNR